ncbi:MAG: ATP-binding protein [Albidovulum sp.]
MTISDTLGEMPKGQSAPDLVHSAPDLLFLRYGRGRVRNFWLRQILTLTGGVTLMAISSVRMGLLLIVLALLGELLDGAVLRGIMRRSATRPITRRDHIRATLSAGVQAAAIVGCVLTPCLTSTTGDADFFVSAFLVAAAINAGVTLPYHRPSAIVRLLLYAAAFVVMVVHNSAMFVTQEMPLSSWGFDAVAMFVLGFVAIGFISHVSKSFANKQRYEAEILAEKSRLEASRAQLVDKERQARQLALVAENANDSIIITDPDGLIIWVNETFRAITGYSDDEAIGRSPADLLNSGETAPETIAKLARAQKSKTPIRTEVLNRRKSGDLIWMETSLTPIFNPDGSHAMTIGVERDISAMKEREAELARARLEAEEATQAKSRFLAAMSHEIRTPMNGVIGMAQILAESPLSDDQRHYVETILESGDALVAIINDILDLTRLQSGKPYTQSVPFSIADCLSGVAELLTPLAEKKGISVVLRLPTPLPPRLAGDAGRVRQILMNVVGNAIKFTETGGVVVAIAHGPDGAGMHLVDIDVKDTGIGIPSDRVDLVFDSFTQADDNITRQFGGTGLGLTISRTLARDMGGDITVRSVEGHGSTFSIRLRLPCAVSDSEDAVQSESAASLPPPTAMKAVQNQKMDLSGYRVLVAEDNATNRLIVGKMLAGLGLDVVFAEDGDKAVQIWRDLSPDLIFMDISMPGMDGYEATGLIRAGEAEDNLRRCPIVALTAHAFDGARSDCLARGFDDFLTKPLAKADLLECVGRCLGTRPVERARAANGL